MVKTFARIYLTKEQKEQRFDKIREHLKKYKKKGEQATDADVFDYMLRRLELAPDLSEVEKYKLV